MPEIGQTLSHFRIVEKIGEGGMGEVYLADDTTLDRKVALKFLPDAFTSDPERMARFDREAKLLASLNHPNIAGIYGLEQADGNRFLVLEYVEGETLQARLINGALPLEDALELYRQIAEGLEAAHEKGVIHRDLKPANVMITAKEKVKILDFGLAKAFSDDTQSIDSSQSPTLTEAMTRPGVILGTAAYMSPEQAKGKNVDKRADIWAFGCILYECLTGKKAFEGETVTETLAAILRGEPDWNRLPSNIHPRIRLLLERCLKKESKNRYHDIADARVDIQEVLSDPEGIFFQPTTSIKTPLKFKPIIPWIAASVVVTALIAWIVAWRMTPREHPQVYYFDYHLPKNQSFTRLGNSLAVSADGRKIVYVANRQLYLKDFKELTARPIQGTSEDPMNPFFSPDGKKVGFLSSADLNLKKISISGGSPDVICQLTQAIRGATWGTDDMIVFGIEGGVMSVSANGGNPKTIVRGEANQSFLNPQILPDGKSILFSVQIQNGFQTYVQSLESEEPTELLQGGPAQYISTGHLVYARDNSIYAVPFDLDTLHVTGEGKTVVEGIFRTTAWLLTSSAISASGTLFYIPGSASVSSQFEWYDRQGNPIELLGEPADYGQFSLSLDDNRIAVERENDIWVLDLDRGGVASRKTSAPSYESDAIWSPTGDSIVFRDLGGIYRKYLAGEKEPELLMPSEESQLLIPEDWSQDGRFIAYLSGVVGRGSGIGLLSMSGDVAPEIVFQEEFVYDEAQFSPDSNWIAYMSNKTGRYEIYIRSLKGEDEPKTISTGGGVQPKWRRGDGKELFYLTPDGFMMAVNIEIAGDEISPGRPEQLFQTGILVDPVRDQYAVTGDGKRFLMLAPLQTTSVSSINIVLNWFEELKQKVPLP
jgi:serine/threonine protein kinase